MTPELEKKIEEDVDKYVDSIAEVDVTTNLFALHKGAIEFVKSDAAKAYWQKGMYTEEEVLALILKFNKDGNLGIFHIEEWFKQNKKK